MGSTSMREGAFLAQPGLAAEEVEIAGRIQLKQPGQEQAAEQFGQDADRQQKAGRDETQRVPSSEMPPPGTIIWICGWCVSAEPQVCSTAVMPMRAPRWRGSAAMVSIVSDAVRNSRS